MRVGGGRVIHIEREREREGGERGEGGERERERERLRGGRETERERDSSFPVCHRLSRRTLKIVMSP